MGAVTLVRYGVDAMFGLRETKDRAAGAVVQRDRCEVTPGQEQ
jgi:hypothetical protein